MKVTTANHKHTTWRVHRRRSTSSAGARRPALLSHAGCEVLRPACLSVSLSVCRSLARLKTTRTSKLHEMFCTRCLWSSSGDNAIRYVLPVLLMTSHFHIMAQYRYRPPWIARWRGTAKSVIVGCLVMAALRSKCGHYIFILWFLSSSSFFLLLLSFSSSPNLSRRRLDVYHTSTNSVALVRI